MSTSTTAAPGWYRDGVTPGQLRWFDGTAWTEHVRDDDASREAGATSDAGSPAATGATTGASDAGSRAEPSAPVATSTVMSWMPAAAADEPAHQAEAAEAWAALTGSSAVPPASPVASAEPVTQQTSPRSDAASSASATTASPWSAPVRYQYGSTASPYAAPTSYPGASRTFTPPPWSVAPSASVYEPFPKPDHGPRTATHWMLPVGRSWQSIVAGYLGLFSLLLFPLGPFAIGFGVWALVRARRGGHGTGRAITGVVCGLLATAFMVLVIVTFGLPPV